VHEPDRPGAARRASVVDSRMPYLGVNIDHVATLRQARYRGQANQPEHGEPDPARALHEAELGGADCITLHLREDRRHINDRDLAACRELCRVKFNLEMAATDEMVAIAQRIKPHLCTLVPEGRMEVTTEGGLDVAGQAARMKHVVGTLLAAGIPSSAFIDADEKQIAASKAAGFIACEVHTGPYARLFAAAGGDLREPALARELARLVTAGRAITAAGMRFNVGHALNYINVTPIATMPDLWELHIGHTIVSRAVYVGLRQAVREMKTLVSRPA
jgi:pyridoxine 5-phosphate synthase